MRFPLVFAAAVFILGLIVAPGCDTVDLGAVPADLNACRPDQRFFYESIWPMFLDRSLNGKKCSDAGCHSATSGRPLLVVAPTTRPTLPLPPDWATLYKSVTEQMQCTNVSESALLIKPSSASHGGGMLIQIDGPEATLVRQWVGIK